MQTGIFSKKLTKEVSDYGITVSEYVMADLVSIGFIKMDAFYIAFPDYQSKSALQARNVMESIVRGDRFKALVKERSRKHGGDTAEVNMSDELLDKKQAAKEILRVAQSLPESSKERGEMFVKYMEMLRKNDESVDAGNDHLNYYLPLTCAKCSLYKQFKDRQREKEVEERRKLEAERPQNRDDYFGEDEEAEE